MKEKSYGLYLQESVAQVITFLKTPQLVLNMQQQGIEHLSDPPLTVLNVSQATLKEFNFGCLCQ